MSDHGDDVSWMVQDTSDAAQTAEASSSPPNGREGVGSRKHPPFVADQLDAQSNRGCPVSPTSEPCSSAKTHLQYSSSSRHSSKHPPDLPPGLPSHNQSFMYELTSAAATTSASPNGQPIAEQPSSSSAASASPSVTTARASSSGTSITGSTRTSSSKLSSLVSTNSIAQHYFEGKIDPSCCSQSWIDEEDGLAEHEKQVNSVCLL